MILKKWNYETHRYDDYKVPDEWLCMYYCDAMYRKINCPHCGKQILFWDSYTSLEIQEELYGWGYGICEECHIKELERRKKYDNE